MIKRLFPILLLAISPSILPGPASAHILNMATGTYVSLENMIGDLKKSPLIFVGEMHGETAHHQAQLQVIKSLYKEGVDLTIGLEMFRSENQDILDGWVSGTIKEQDFVKSYNQNWSMWPKYREIFLFARDNNIPMIGLNIPRSITAQVARDGYSSLTKDQRAEIPAVQCDVDQTYMDFILRSLGAHSHGDVSFLNFCEAQLLWDTVMAKTLVQYLSIHPQKNIVVLTGGGHAWKHGIPKQVGKYSDYSFKVLLPEVPGRIHPANATLGEADYLLLGLSEGPLH